MTEAHKRLGDDPVETLFRQTGNLWGCERYSQDSWNGLQVFAADGALLRTPDTPELRAHFGSGNTGTECQTPFPILRLIALMNVRSHVLVDARLGPYRTSEMRCAEQILESIPEHSVTLFDKGFWGADLLLSVSCNAHNRHWLTPARKKLVVEEIERYGEHDRLIRMKSSPQARKRNPTLPTHWEAREVGYEGRTGIRHLMTSLPACDYSAEDVAALYLERREIELGFRDIKSSMQQNAVTLRSKEVELIYQEVWRLLLAYNIVRREASQAAKAFGRAPADIRFKPACQYIAVQLIVMAAANPISATGRRLAELRGGLRGLFLDHRPRLGRPRTVKISKTRYPVDRKAAPLK